MLDATTPNCRWFAAERGVYPRIVAALDAGTSNMRLSLRCVIWCVMPVAAVFGLAAAHAQLRGHGGPIRALAISADGMTVLSGSFDTSAIRWSLRYNLAEQVLRLHESAVNAVAILNDGRAVTAGADAIIGIWTSSTNRSINRSRPFRHTPFQGKFVEQRVLIDLPLPHHRLPPSCRDARLYRACHAVFQHNPP